MPSDRGAAAWRRDGDAVRAASLSPGAQGLDGGDRSARPARDQRLVGLGLDTMVSTATLAQWVVDARSRTFELVADLDDPQLIGPHLSIVNPMLWEIGHVAWFQEKWVLRHALHEPPIRPDGDALWDSAAVAHDTRWDLPLPTRQDTLAYMTEVQDRVLDRLARSGSDPRLLYFALYAVFHEDMHDEAFTYTRQTHGYPAPRLSGRGAAPAEAGSLARDLQGARGTPLPRATPTRPFAVPYKKLAHPR